MMEIKPTAEQGVLNSDSQQSTQKVLTSEQVRNALLQKIAITEQKMESFDVVRFTQQEAKLFYALIKKYSFNLLLTQTEENNLATIKAFIENNLGSPDQRLTHEDIETFRPIIKKLSDFAKQSSITEHSSLAFRHVQKDTAQLAENVIKDAEINGGKSPDNQSDAGICVTFEDLGKIHDDYLTYDKANILFVYDASKLTGLSVDEMAASSKWRAGYGVKAADGHTLRDAIMGVIILEPINFYKK